MKRSDAGGADRRKYVRLDEEDLLVCEPVSIETSDPHAHEKFYAFTRNISEGGILFESDTFFEIGTILKLQIDIPGWEKIEAELKTGAKSADQKTLVVLGKVVRVDDISAHRFEVGVTFMASDALQQQTLKKYVSRNKDNTGS